MSRAATVQEYAGQIWRYRHFWTSLVVLDLRARYRRSALGVGWALLHPLAMATVLSAVFFQLFDLELRTYLPYVFSGIAIWNYLTAVTMEGCHSLNVGEKYIRAHPRPLAIYSLRTVLSLSIHFLIVLAMTLLITFICKGFANPVALLALIPALALLFVFGWAMATTFGFINVYFPDTINLMQIAFQVLYFLTPVFYPPEMIKARLVEQVIDYNPLGYFVQLIRMPILDGQVPGWNLVAPAVLTVALTVAVAVHFLKRHERTIVFYM